MNKAFKKIILILFIAADCFLLRIAVIQYEDIKYFRGDCFRYPPANSTLEAWERYHEGEISERELRSIDIEESDSGYGPWPPELEGAHRI